MRSTTPVPTTIQQLPAFGRYLKQQCADAFAAFELSGLQELSLQHPPTDPASVSLEERAHRITHHLLDALSQAPATLPLAALLQLWITGEAEDKNVPEPALEDLSAFAYFQKKALLHFLPGHCPDLSEALALIGEIDALFFESERTARSRQASQLQRQLQEHAHFIEKITDTSPGVIYVYDVLENREVYSNRQVSDTLGYSPKELVDLGPDFVDRLIHPDDAPRIRAHDEAFADIADGEVRSIRYRIRNQEGQYRWMRAYETVFKRESDGRVCQKIGIAIDVQEPMLTAEKLRKREAQLLEAQEIAGTGSFEWDLQTGASESTPQLHLILGIQGDITPQACLERIDPADAPRIKAQVLKAISDGSSFQCEFHYLGDRQEQVLQLKGKAERLNGQPQYVRGTIMDITDRMQLVEQLQQSEALYKQAQALSHIGHFILNLETQEIIFTEEMFRIYELEPTPDNTLAYARIKEFRHPDDFQKMEAAVAEMVREHKPMKIEWRIRTAAGNDKTIHSVVELLPDNEGRPARLLGTAQDVTERDALLHRLKQTDQLYRESEVLANMGNYHWNLQTNMIQWTDHLYRIYGITRDSGPISLERFMSFIHPDDRAQLDESMETLFRHDYIDYTFRICTPAGDVKTIRSIAKLRRDSSGQAVEVVGTERDITEKQKLIAQLRKSESLYKQAQSMAQLGNWSWQIDGNQLHWSDELYRIFGLEPGEPLDFERYRSLLHPDDSAQVLQTIQQCLADGQPYEVNHRIQFPDGSLKKVHSRGEALIGKDGKPYMLVGTAQDVTEHQTLVDRLRQSESLYKQAQSLVHLGSWMLDLETMQFSWSDEMYRIYELPVGIPFTIQDWERYIHPDDRQEVLAYYEECLRNRTDYDKTHRIVLSDGRQKTLHRKAELVLDAEGKPVRMLGTTQDITEREQLLKRLRESEQLYKQAQAMAKLGNFAWDLATNKVYWSEEVYRIYELPADREITFDDVFSFILPEYQAAVQRAIEQTIGKRKGHSISYAIRTPGGNQKFINLETDVVVDSQQQVVRILGTAQDMTEQHLIQQALKENQTFIRKITDATPSIIASYNVHTGQFVYISEGVEKLLGYERKRPIQEGVAFFANLVHPEEIEEVNSRTSRTLAEVDARPDGKDPVIEITYRMKHQNGDYRWFHTYTTIFDRNAEGKVEHLLNITLDVTEQVEASKKIKEQEHFIQHIADASPTILYLYDVDSQSYGYINREIFFVLGYLPEEILEMGAGVTDRLVHPDDHHLLPARQQSSKKFQQTDSMIQYECRMKHKNGNWCWLLIREIVFKTDEEGVIRQILGAALDISRRKDMERTILQNAFQLEQSNASLEEFAYVASHDLKEPLRKISTFGDRLAATLKDNLSPEGKLYLSKIIDASQRMQTMISDLLSISIITGNRSFELHSLQRILEETLQTLEYKIEQLDAAVESDGLPDALIVPAQFRQLFQNLLSNSLKFIRPEEPPRILVTHAYITAADTRLYNLKAAERYLRIDFRDNGIGFENEMAGKIFTIFQRLHGRSEYEGSGIGLAICKKIVEHHGGVIFAQGAPGEGATFTLILPA